MKTRNLVIITLAVAIDCYFVYHQNAFAAWLLATALVLMGVWLFLAAPEVWDSYKKMYKKASPKRKKLMGKPQAQYYYINRFIIAPVLVATGLLSGYLAILITRG